MKYAISFLLPTLFCGILFGQSSLYWANNGNFSIYKSFVDGSEVERIFETEAGGSQSLAVDAENGFMFWGGTNYIRRGRLDGTEPMILTQEYGIIGDIVVDPANYIFYFSERSGNIYRSNYDATEVEVLIETDGAEGLFLDLVNQKIYWTSWIITPGIYVADLDGSNVTPLITEDLGRPYSISIDLENGKMYWCDQVRKEIARSDLDGQNREQIFEDITLFSIIVEPATQKLYLASIENFVSFIQTMNTDGSGVDTLLQMDDGLSFPRAMDLVVDISSPVNEVALDVNITIAPNPSTSSVIINSSEEISVIQLVDINGKHLQEVAVNAHQATLDVSRFPDGVYFAHLRLANGENVGRKIIISH